jgi:hypothetical protein
MAAERLSMRQIREVLRQKSGAWGSATRPPPAASASGWARSPAWLARARVIGLDWPQLQALTDGVLEPRLYGRPEVKLTGHKTEAMYRRYAIVAESDLRDAGTKLAAMLGTTPESAPLSDNSGDNSLTARSRVG